VEAFSISMKKNNQYAFSHPTFHQYPPIFAASKKSAGNQAVNT
jgi:hypothetical protein